MLYRIAICDDEEKELTRIDDFLMHFSMKTDIDFKTTKFNSGESLVEHYGGKQNLFDIIFLDVEMCELTGIQTADKIRSIPDRNVIIIFITSYPEYMQDSFDVQASQYLSKPLSYNDFSIQMQKTIKYLTEIETNITVVSLKNENIVLHLDDVVCIETAPSMTLKSNLTVTTVDGEIDIKGKLTDFEKALKSQYFISVHRSVLANMKYIKRFNSDVVEFMNGKQVDMSRRRVADVKETFSKYTVMRYKK